MSVKDFFGNWVVKNILLAIGLVVALVVVASITLSIVTHHGNAQSVPDFTGMTASQAASAAKSHGIRTEVVDSIYVKRMPRGSVVRQEPKPGAKVKKGRRIQLIINAKSPKQIPMPDLVGYSLRSAKAELAACGLELGNLIYINDMATNNVLRQIYRHSEIAPGRMIPGESRIDLVLGLNDEDNVTTVPNLLGEKYRQALDHIHDNYMNVGSVRFDKGIRTYVDSLNAVVYRQSPDDIGNATVMGRTVSIYLTLDADKLPAGVKLSE